MRVHVSREALMGGGGVMGELFLGDSLALAEKCKVVTDGVYVGMFFSSHYDDMAAAFQSALS